MFGATALTASLLPPFASMTFIPTVLYLIGSLFSGFGTTLMLVMLAHLFDGMPTRIVLTYSIIAMLVTAIATTALSFLDHRLLYAIISIVGALVGFTEYRASKYPLSRHTRTPSFPTQDRTFPWKFISMAAVLGLSNGIAECQLNLIDCLPPIINSVALSGAALALVIFAFVAKFSFSQMIYQAGFSFIAIGSLLFTLEPSLSPIGLALLLSGFYFTYFAVWGLCTMLTRYLQQSATWTVAFSTASLMFGQVGGGIISTVAIFFVSAISEQPIILTTYVFDLGPIATISLLLSAVVFSTALASAGDKSFRSGWGATKPADDRSSDESPQNAIIEQLAATAGLTNREKQVLSILAQGRGRQFVQRELVISDNTAKTHIRNIYIKLGVHSMRELTNMLDELNEQFNDNKYPE